MKQRISAAILLWLTAVISSLRAQAPAAKQHHVFAHYMVTNQDYQGDTDPTQEAKIAAYQREILEAQAIGIDGFALNVGGWLREPYYIRYTAQMFEAAVRLHSGFKLMFSADMCCGNTTDDIEDMMRRFAGNPRYSPVYFQQNGHFVLSTFAGDKLGPAAWIQMRLDLLKGTRPSKTIVPAALAPAREAPSNAPVRTMFVPSFFWGGEVPDKASIAAGVNSWGPALDGAFYWGIAGVPGSKSLDTASSSRNYAQILHAAGKVYVAPVALQFWGANANRYYEYSGAAGMRALWKAAIDTNADWVEIITWNDFIEGTYISPIDDPNRYPGANFLTASGVPSSTLHYFHSHAGAGDLLAWFIAWFKSGAAPPITRDELFYFYRTQPVTITATKPTIAHTFGPFEDRIYVTANLTSPATLTIRCGTVEKTQTLSAGSTDVAAPFIAGCTPAFELIRKGKLDLSGIAHESIDPHPQFRNLYYVTGNLRASEAK